PRALSLARGERHLKLVQFNAPPIDSELADLAATGARIVQYVPENAYLVWSATDTVTQALQRLSSKSAPLQYYGEYDPAYALAPSLDQYLPTSEEVEVTVQVFNHSAAVSADVAQLKALATTVVTDASETMGGRYLNLRLVVRGADLVALAQVDS